MNILKAFIFLLFFTSSYISVAQEKNESFIKASYVINFIEEIRWSNEEDIKDFKIGVLNNTEVYLDLKNLLKGKTIRGKELIVVSYDHIFEINKVDVLFLSEAYSRKFDRYKHLGSNCLIISDNSKSSEDKMINFYSNDASSIQFELNLEYLKSKGFSSSLKLLVFGGYSDEILGVFYESEEALKREKKRLKKRNAEIKDKELRIWKLGQEITKKEADIKKSKRSLNEQEISRKTLSKQLLEQKKLISDYDADIRKHKAIDRKGQKHLLAILEQLKSQKEHIDENIEILANQKHKITAQEAQLVQKDSELKNSMMIVITITLALLLLSILLYLLYRANKSKKQVLKLIEQKNQEIIKGSHHKDEFIANMSHEIRTPLNAIVGFTNLLIGKAKLPQNKNYLNKVLLSSNNLLINMCHPREKLGWRK